MIEMVNVFQPTIINPLLHTNKYMSLKYTSFSYIVIFNLSFNMFFEIFEIDSAFCLNFKISLQK